MYHFHAVIIFRQAGQKPIHIKSIYIRLHETHNTNYIAHILDFSIELSMYQSRVLILIISTELEIHFEDFQLTYTNL